MHEMTGLREPRGDPRRGGPPARGDLPRELPVLLARRRPWSGCGRVALLAVASSNRLLIDLVLELPDWRASFRRLSRRKRSSAVSLRPT